MKQPQPPDQAHDSSAVAGYAAHDADPRAPFSSLTDRAAPGGASKCIRPSYRRPDADAPAPKGRSEPVPPGAGAHSAAPDGLRPQALPEDKPTAPRAKTAAARRAERASAHRPPSRRTRDSENPKKKTLTFRCNPEEIAEIRRRADHAHQAVAKYIVRKVFAEDATGVITHDEQLDAAIDELAALRAQIARLGNNVNQLTRDYNAVGALRPGPLLDALTQGRALLSQARQAAVEIDAVSTRLARRKAHR
jgi:hypothetical protein